MLALPTALAERGFALRAEAEEDVPFLRRLHASTRWQELAITGWSEEQKLAFLDSQFALQRHHYRTYYASTEWAVIEKDGAPAGRIYVDRQENTLLVVDVCLLPEWRGQGVGTMLMESVCAEAHAAGKSVSITVEKYNPAQTLYRRMGFREVADEGVYWSMEWRAPLDGSAASEGQLNTA